MKDDNLYLLHMLELARQARHFAKGKTWDDFDQDRLLQLGLVHLVQTIGEAARHVSRDFQEAHSTIPWSDIVGMRHKVVHDYIRIDRKIVWKTVTEDIEPLIVELEALLPRHLWKYLEDDTPPS